MGRDWVYEAKRQRDAGETVRQIAEGLGKPYETVRSALRRSQSRKVHRFEPVQTTRPLILVEVAAGYMRALSDGALTKGFATLDTRVVSVRTRLSSQELFEALRKLQSESLLIVQAMDASGIDVALTAAGMGVYMTGVRA